MVVLNTGSLLIALCHEKTGTIPIVSDAFSYPASPRGEKEARAGNCFAPALKYTPLIVFLPSI